MISTTEYSLPNLRLYLIRQARQEVMDEIDAAKKEGEISEDDQHKKREAVQLQVTATNQELETLFEHKEKAIITV